MGKTPRREPVQVYLDSDEKALLEQVASQSGLAQAEVMRRGLHRIAHDLLAESTPGYSLNRLIGALDETGTAPNDLAARHDEYLYADDKP